MLQAVMAGDVGEEASIRYLKAKLKILQVPNQLHLPCVFVCYFSTPVAYTLIKNTCSFIFASILFPGHLITAVPFLYILQRQQVVYMYINIFLLTLYN